MKINHARIADCTRTLYNCSRKNGVTCEDYSSRILLFFQEFEVFDAKYRRQARIPSAWKFVRGLWTQQKSKLWCRSSKPKCHVKISHQDTGTVDSDCNGLCFNLGQFTPHLSGTFWNVKPLVCLSVIDGRQLMFTQSVAIHTQDVFSNLYLLFCAWVHDFLCIPAFWK